MNQMFDCAKAAELIRKTFLLYAGVALSILFVLSLPRTDPIYTEAIAAIGELQQNSIGEQSVSAALIANVPEVQEESEILRHRISAALLAADIDVDELVIDENSTLFLMGGIWPRAFLFQGTVGDATRNISTYIDNDISAPVDIWTPIRDTISVERASREAIRIPHVSIRFAVADAVCDEDEICRIVAHLTPIDPEAQSEEVPRNVTLQFTRVRRMLEVESSRSIYLHHRPDILATYENDGQPTERGAFHIDNPFDLRALTPSIIYNAVLNLPLNEARQELQSRAERSQQSLSVLGITIQSRYVIVFSPLILLFLSVYLFSMFIRIANSPVMCRRISRHFVPIFFPEYFGQLLRLSIFAMTPAYVAIRAGGFLIADWISGDFLLLPNTVIFISTALLVFVSFLLLVTGTAIAKTMVPSFRSVRVYQYLKATNWL